MSTAFADSGQSAIEQPAAMPAVSDHATGQAVLDQPSGQAPSVQGNAGQAPPGQETVPATVPANLSEMTVEELLELSSQSYRQLDRKHPVRDALVQYYAIARELETREAQG
ncbi:hypothetical protein ACMX2H_05765 [Arthrobacter sulfonylureivorans]|uniref:hypothetical protein n=1 Tax=Arthrobacter sulfonylureivorans TaxID=2486855 RepID=UPI0039E2A913